MIQFLIAEIDDTEELTRIQAETFDIEANKQGINENRGPDGYDSQEEQVKVIRHTKYYYYKMIDNKMIIGGFYISEKEAGHFHVHRIFIDPVYQKKGIGKQAFSFMEKQYPNVKKWTLDTPEWSKGNHYFYEKIGFKKLDVQYYNEISFGLFLYEKIIL